MAVFTIAGLTLKEAVRRKTLVGALLMGLLILGLSLMYSVIHLRLQHRVESGAEPPEWMALRLTIAFSVITSLCLSAIKSLGAVFGALLAGGAISSEIERGLLAVILPKPIPRWQILLGKWLGINVVLVGSSLLWTVFVWASMSWQKHANYPQILHASPFLAVFPILISTLALTFSTIAPRLFGTTLALTLGAFAWFDGIFNLLGTGFDVETLHTLANVAGVIVPQGYVGWWVEHAMGDIVVANPRGRGLGESPQFLTHLGQKYLHIAHLDALYVAVYIVTVLLIGMALLQRRDI